MGLEVRIIASHDVSLQTPTTTTALITSDDESVAERDR